MGKRSRKRVAGSGRPPAVKAGAAARPAPHARSVQRKAHRSEAPPAPWSPFPLVELCILAGLILIIVGFLGGGDRRGSLLVLGFALVSLSAVELSVREHFGGYRSHTTLLAAVIAIVPLVPVFLLTGLPQVVLFIFGVTVFAVAFFALRATFARRSGGLAFRA